jgi:hypothetical protein
MAAPRIIDPTSFKAVMQFNKTILESACIANKDEARTDQFVKAEDRDQFVKAVFQYFVAQGGAEIMKQLVAIKHNPDAHHAIFQDNECKEILEQNWFFFISHFVNFGRPTFNKNGVCTDADQFDDFHHIHLSHSFDNFLYTLIGNRGFPSKHDLGLSIAISIRHDLVNLIIETFVQTLFNNEVSSPRDLADRLRFLEAEYSQLKEHLAAMPPQAKRQKPNPDSESELNMDDGNVLHDDALGDALDDKVSLDAQVATELNDVPAEQTTQVATELNDVPAEQTHDAHDATNVDAELNDVPAESDEVPAESDEVPAESDEVPAESDEVPAESDEVPAESDEVPAESGFQGQSSNQQNLNSGNPWNLLDAKKLHAQKNPWVEICDQHNTIMSNINPEQWNRKNRATVMKELLKKLAKDHGGQPNVMAMSLVRAIRDSSGNVDSNHLWDEPLFSDVNDENPTPKTFSEIMGTLCNIIKENWKKIQEALHSAK